MKLGEVDEITGPRVAPYAVHDLSQIPSPALLLFRELIEANIDEMIRVAGSAARLRPHCKTHKLGPIIALELARGITKHKCATIAEAEMLALAGVRDILLAYNIVGPNIARVIQLVEQFPGLELIVTADHPQPVAELSRAISSRTSAVKIGVLLDLDSGMQRTGLPPGEAAIALYTQISQAPGLRAAGIHLYDGQNHQREIGERISAVTHCWNLAKQFAAELESRGLAVPAIVAGGTGSFPVYAAIQDARLELSPGTVVLHDQGYSETYADLKFTPAAALLTRVISRPTERRVTFDLGYKAVASDPPMASRLILPALPDAKIVLHNEEHLVLETPGICDLQPGDACLAIPRHICPTTALHEVVYVISQGRLETTWQVAARRRTLSI